MDANPSPSPTSTPSATVTPEEQLDKARAENQALRQKLEAADRLNKELKKQLFMMSTQSFSV